jgi:hypothetical protein
MITGESKMFSDENVRALHVEDEKLLQSLAKRAVGKKVHLSYFERQQIVDLHLDKALDAHGNLDLNLAANLMTQTVGMRISPNVLFAAKTFVTEGMVYNDEPAPQEKTPSDGVLNALDEATKVAKRRTNEKAKCFQHCYKSHGRPNCPYCHGQGQEAGLRMNSATHQSRENVGV